MLYNESNKSDFLIGEATHGHHQIEMACSSCHLEPFGGSELIQSACLDCHEGELKLSQDSHPEKKFRDPRNAALLEIIDARYCITCHTEHKKDQTTEMGLTVPADYCFHCHEEIGNERKSHEGLTFESCATSGCHNYHDNRALYEDFLVDQANKPWLNPHGVFVKPTHAALHASYEADANEITQLPEQQLKHPDIFNQWQHSKHGKTQVTCQGCHTNGSDAWIEKPGIQVCQNCHQLEAEGYLSGKHGMKLAAGLNPMTPEDSSMNFTYSSMDIEHGCNSCHSAHSTDTVFAAKDACLGCHNDEHSTAFNSSPHGQAFNLALNNQQSLEGTVSCASCHMPRLKNPDGGSNDIFVQHNQNDNLRPNEKMIRSVCLSCHSLEFSIDALADPELILNNFSGAPSKHIPSIDWALERVSD